MTSVTRVYLFSFLLRTRAFARPYISELLPTSRRVNGGRKQWSIVGTLKLFRFVAKYRKPRYGPELVGASCGREERWVEELLPNSVCFSCSCIVRFFRFFSGTCVSKSPVACSASVPRRVMFSTRFVWPTV